MTEKRGMKALEAWCRKVTNGYRDVKINNMTTAWRDGMAFCAIIHHFQPDLIDFDSLCKENIFQNNDLAFSMAERLGIPALLDAEDMVSYKVPDKLSILTYVSQLYQHFHALEPPSPAKRPLEVNEDATDSAEMPEKRSAIEVPSASFPAAAKLPPSIQRTDVCQACKNRVYILERLIVDNKLYHRTCFKCLKCSTVLSPGSYVECDQSDRYECIQCPLPDEKLAQKRLSEDVLKKFSDTPNGTNVKPSSLSTTSQKTSRISMFEGVPKPSIIADAAAKARSRFHDQNLNDVGSENSTFLDTGQPSIEKPSESPQHAIGEIAQPLPDAASSITQPDSRGDSSTTENTQRLETPPSSDHPSALPSVSNGYGDLSSDVRNNNVKMPPSVKPPLPPGGEADTSDCTAIAAAKPALPQKPALLERPRFLPLQRPNQATKQPVEISSSELDKESAPCAATDAAFERDGSGTKKVPDPDVAAVFKDEVDSSETGNVSREDVATVSTDLVEGSATCSDFANVEDSSETGKVSSLDIATRNDGINANVIDEPISKNSDPSGVVVCDRPVPVAAPRASRAKRQQAQVPQKQESRAAPAPPRRSAAPTLEDGTGEVPTPPKPPRYVAVSGDSTDATRTEKPLVATSNGLDYPVDLNPFGDDDESEATQTAVAKEEPPKKKESLNPFGDSDDEDDAQEQVVPKAPEPVQRRLVPCYVNPFSSDSEEDSEGSSRFSVSPVSSLRKAAVASRHAATSSPAESASATTMRKKRPAPRPPSAVGSLTSSPGITPQTTPRPAQRNPPPPPKRIVPYKVSDEAYLTEKSLKELDNRNRTRAGQEPMLREGPASNPLSPDSLESQSEPGEPSEQHGQARLPNTFGNWKRKKKRAPPLPIPRRRQVAKISIKDIQTELLEIEEKHLELEMRGVEIEKSIREKFNDEIDPSVEEEDLIIQLFDLVNRKNELFRRQTELTYLKRQQRLEEEHADLEFQIRCLMEKSDDKKTDEDRALEDQLIARLVEVVTQRSEIIESMEMDRVREAEEDQSLQKQHLGLQVCGSNRGSMSSQGSLNASAASGTLSTTGSPSGKDKSIKKKKKKDKEKDKEKKKKSTKVKDEDKDTDETESRKKTPKDKPKKKWF